LSLTGIQGKIEIRSLTSLCVTISLRGKTDFLQ